MYHYIHGVMSYAYVQPDVETIKKDLPEGLYRLLGVKQNYWYSTSPTWQAGPSAIQKRA
jgi:TetR/AcrR family transcriptional repressor of nem operon